MQGAPPIYICHAHLTHSLTLTSHTHTHSLSLYFYLFSFSFVFSHGLSFDTAFRHTKETTCLCSLQPPNFFLLFLPPSSEMSATPQTKTPLLFQPWSIGPLKLENRIVIPPLCMYQANKGKMGAFHEMHIGSMATSGAGLVIIEATGVCPEGRISNRCCGLWDDETAEAMKKVLDRVREYSKTPIAIQLQHAGRKGSAGTPKEEMWETVAPSAIKFDTSDTVPRALTLAEMEKIKDDFAVHRAMKPLNIPVWVRISATEWSAEVETHHPELAVVESEKKPLNPPGWNADDSVVFCKKLKELGCELISVSTGGNLNDQHLPSLFPGYQLPFSQRLRMEVGVQTIGVGLITTPLEAELALQVRTCDAVGVGRAMLFNPRWGYLAAHELGHGAKISNVPISFQRAEPRPIQHIFAEVNMYQIVSFIMISIIMLVSPNALFSLVYVLCAVLSRRGAKRKGLCMCMCERCAEYINIYIYIYIYIYILSLPVERIPLRESSKRNSVAERWVIVISVIGAKTIGFFYSVFFFVLRLKFLFLFLSLNFSFLFFCSCGAIFSTTSGRDERIWVSYTGIDSEFAASSMSMYSHKVAHTAPMLFQPWAVGPLQLRNRIVIPPMCMFSSKKGKVGAFHEMHIGSMATSGAGLVILESTGVCPEGRITSRCPGLWDDETAEAMKKVLDRVREYSKTPIAIQLAHAGRKGSHATPKEEAWEPVAPSAIPWSDKYAMPRALTLEDIEQTKEYFVAAAKRAAAIGMSGIEAVHRAMKPLNIPVWVRISATEWSAEVETHHPELAVVESEKKPLNPPGWNADDSVVFCKKLKELGCELISVSCGGNLCTQKIPPLYAGYQMTYSRQVRQEVGVQTIGVGMITTPMEAELALQVRTCDAVGVGRAMLFNPHWGYLAAHELGCGATVDAPACYRRSEPRPIQEIFENMHESHQDSRMEYIYIYYLKIIISLQPIERPCIVEQKTRKRSSRAHEREERETPIINRTTLIVVVASCGGSRHRNKYKKPGKKKKSNNELEHLLLLLKKKNNNKKNTTDRQQFTCTVSASKERAKERDVGAFHFHTHVFSSFRLLCFGINFIIIIVFFFSFFWKNNNIYIYIYIYIFAFRGVGAIPQAMIIIMFKLYHTIFYILYTFDRGGGGRGLCECVGQKRRFIIALCNTSDTEDNNNNNKKRRNRSNNNNNRRRDKCCLLDVETITIECKKDETFTFLLSSHNLPLSLSLSLSLPLCFFPRLYICLFFFIPPVSLKGGESFLRIKQYINTLIICIYILYYTIYLLLSSLAFASPLWEAQGPHCRCCSSIPPTSSPLIPPFYSVDYLNKVPYLSFFKRQKKGKPNKTDSPGPFLLHLSFSFSEGGGDAPQQPPAHAAVLDRWRTAAITPYCSSPGSASELCLRRCNARAGWRTKLPNTLGTTVAPPPSLPLTLAPRGAESTSSTPGTSVDDVRAKQELEELTTGVLFIVMLIFLGGTFFLTCEKRIPLPHTVVLFLYGLVVGCITLWVSPDVGEALGNIPPDLLFFIFLPVLIFEGSYSMNSFAFRRVLWQTTILATLGILVNTAILAVAVKTMFPTWTWYTACLLGSLLSATDPVAVVSLLKNLRVDKFLTAMVDGEAVMNDGTAIIIFTVLMPAELAGHLTDSPLVLFGTSVRLLLIPVVLGPIFGFVQLFWLRHTHDPLVKACVTVSVSYVSYFIAMKYVGTSAVLTLCFEGVFLSYYYPSLFPGKESNFVSATWEFLVHLSNTVLFSLVGVILVADVLPTMRFMDVFLILVLYVVMVMARFFMLELLLPIVNLFPRKMNQRDVLLLTHAGLRGGVAVTLALAVKQKDIEQGIPILKLTSGVVLLTLLINATTAGYVVEQLGFKIKEEYRHIEMKYGMRYIKDTEVRALETVKRDTKYKNTNWHMVEKYLNKHLRNPFRGTAMAVEGEELSLNRLTMSAFKASLWRQRDELVISETVIQQLTSLTNELIEKGELFEVRRLALFHRWGEERRRGPPSTRRGSTQRRYSVANSILSAVPSATNQPEDHGAGAVPLGLEPRVGIAPHCSSSNHSHPHRGATPTSTTRGEGAPRAQVEEMEELHDSPHMPGDHHRRQVQHIQANNFAGNTPLRKERGGPQPGGPGSTSSHPRLNSGTNNAAASAAGVTTTIVFPPPPGGMLPAAGAEGDRYGRLYSEVSLSSQVGHNTGPPSGSAAKSLMHSFSMLLPRLDPPHGANGAVQEIKPAEESLKRRLKANSSRGAAPRGKGGSSLAGGDTDDDDDDDDDDGVEEDGGLDVDVEAGPSNDSAAALEEQENADATTFAIMQRLLPLWVVLAERIVGNGFFKSAHRRAQENGFMTILAVVKCLTSLANIKYQHVTSPAQARRINRWLNEQLKDAHACMNFFYSNFPEVTSFVSSTRAVLSVAHSIQEAIDSLHLHHGFGTKITEMLNNLVADVRDHLPSSWGRNNHQKEVDLVMRAVASTTLGKGLRRAEISAITSMGLVRKFKEGDVITLPNNAFLVVVFGSLRTLRHPWTTAHADHDLIESFGDTVGLDAFLLPASMRLVDRRRWEVITGEATALLISFQSIQPFLTERSLRAVKALWRAAAVEAILPILEEMITVPPGDVENRREHLMGLVMAGTPLIGPEDCNRFDDHTPFHLCFYLRGTDSRGFFTRDLPPCHVSTFYLSQVQWTSPDVVLYVVPVNISDGGYVPWGSGSGAESDKNHPNDPSSMRRASDSRQPRVSGPAAVGSCTTLQKGNQETMESVRERKKKKRGSPRGASPSSLPFPSAVGLMQGRGASGWTSPPRTSTPVSGHNSSAPRHSPRHVSQRHTPQHLHPPPAAPVDATLLPRPQPTESPLPPADREVRQEQQQLESQKDEGGGMGGVSTSTAPTFHPPSVSGTEERVRRGSGEQLLRHSTGSFALPEKNTPANGVVDAVEGHINTAEEDTEEGTLLEGTDTLRSMTDPNTSLAGMRQPIPRFRSRPRQRGETAAEAAAAAAVAAVADAAAAAASDSATFGTAMRVLSRVLVGVVPMEDNGPDDPAGVGDSTELYAATLEASTTFGSPLVGRRASSFPTTPRGAGGRDGGAGLGFAQRSPSAPRHSGSTADGERCCVLQSFSHFVTPVPMVNQLFAVYASILEQLCIAALRYVLLPSDLLNIQHAQRVSAKTVDYLLQFSMQVHLLQQALEGIQQRHNRRSGVPRFGSMNSITPPGHTTDALGSSLGPGGGGIPYSVEGNLYDGRATDASFHIKVCQWAHQAQRCGRYHLRTMILSMRAYANARFEGIATALQQAVLLQPDLAKVENVENLQAFLQLSGPNAPFHPPSPSGPEWGSRSPSAAAAAAAAQPPSTSAGTTGTSPALSAGAAASQQPSRMGAGAGMASLDISAGRRSSSTIRSFRIPTPPLSPPFLSVTDVERHHALEGSDFQLPPAAGMQMGTTKIPAAMEPGWMPLPSQDVEAAAVEEFQTVIGKSVTQAGNSRTEDFEEEEEEEAEAARRRRATLTARSSVSTFDAIRLDAMGRNPLTTLRFKLSLCSICFFLSYAEWIHH
eukprot:gene9837-6910_t